MVCPKLYVLPLRNSDEWMPTDSRKSNVIYIFKRGENGHSDELPTNVKLTILRKILKYGTKLL